MCCVLGAREVKGQDEVRSLKDGGLGFTTKFCKRGVWQELVKQTTVALFGSSLLCSFLAGTCKNSN